MFFWENVMKYKMTKEEQLENFADWIHNNWYQPYGTEFY